MTSDKVLYGDGDQVQNGLINLFSLSQYSAITCGTLLTYDILCTFDQEVAYVWLSPWSLGKLLYFVSRYLPFIDVFVMIHLVTRHNTTEQCRIGYGVASLLMIFGAWFSELVLMIRTYAIWARRRSILATFCGLGLFLFLPSIILGYYAQASVEYTETPLYVTSCVAINVKNRFITTSFVLLVIAETTIVILTMVKASQHLRHSRSIWVSKLYSDGLIFYIYTLALSLTNAFSVVFAPPASVFLYPLQRIFHSIFSSRVLLLILRQHVSSQSSDSTTLPYSHPTSISLQIDETSLSLQNNRDTIALSNIPGGTSSDLPGRPTISRDCDIL